MTDDVVQLAGDPRPLVAEGDLGEEFTLILELLDAQGQLVGGLPAQSQYPRGGVRRAQPPATPASGYVLVVASREVKGGLIRIRPLRRRGVSSNPQT